MAEQQGPARRVQEAPEGGEGIRTTNATLTRCTRRIRTTAAHAPTCTPDQVKPLGYEDEPKGGIPMPMASFGVGGEFGTGGKYDNGERFDLRLPFADQG